jgi:aryl-alcohol dehydrogenase-like predicted oxidoreductase
VTGTALDLSFPAILGTGGFDVTRPAEVAALLEAYLDAGGRVLDTARVYGTSEDAIGAWLHAHGEAPGLQILTKGGHPELSTWRSRLSRDEVLADARTSAARLGRAADLYLLHRDDLGVPLEEVADTLRAVVDEGLSHAVGVSNWNLDRMRGLREALADRSLELGTMSDHFGLAVTTVPSEYPGGRSLDAPTLAWLEESGVTQLSWSSQSSGYFAGIPVAHYAGPENERRRERLDRVADAAGVRPDAVLARWSASVSPRIVPIMASRSPERLRRALRDVTDTSLEPVVDELVRAVDPSGSLGRALIAPDAAW